MHKLILFLSILLFAGCVKESETVTETPRFPTLMEIPQGFPEMPHPEGNEFTQERWELGKKLFLTPSFHQIIALVVPLVMSQA